MTNNLTARWAALCDLAFFDSLGRLCLIGVNRTIAVPRFPTVIYQLTLAVELTGTATTISTRVHVHRPQGDGGLPDAEGAVNAQFKYPYVLFTIRELPLSVEGPYVFSVIVDETPVARVTLDVVLGPPSAAGVAN